MMCVKMFGTERCKQNISVAPAQGLIDLARDVKTLFLLLLFWWVGDRRVLWKLFFRPFGGSSVLVRSAVTLLPSKVLTGSSSGSINFQASSLGKNDCLAAYEILRAMRLAWFSVLLERV